MAGPGFTQVFGGSVIYPSQTTYLPLTISVNTALEWPLEQSSGGAPIVSDIVDVTATVGSLAISFADARQVSTGYTALFNNVGSNTFSLKDQGGNTIASIASGQAWIVYLADNSTANGTWRIFQMGAGTSSANAAALAGAGLKAITTTLNQRYTVNTQNSNYAILVADRASCIEWTGGTGTLTSPDPTAAGSDWFCLVKNNGSGNATFTPFSGTIDGSATLVFGPDTSAFVLCDGTNFITVGFGQQLNAIFDFVSIDVSGGAGDYVLAGAQLNRISYRFTGALTGNRRVVVPTTIQQYWVDNETTGAFTLNVSTSGGSGTTVGQGSRNILYCDGVNVVAAATFGATGFISGSAAAPSIFFAADPATGIYQGVPSNIDFATGGIRRANISSGGQFSIAGPPSALSTLLVFGATIAGSIVTQISNPFSSSSTTPILSLQSTAANGFAQFSILGNASVGVIGTDDLSIFQNGTNYSATIINRHSGAALNIVTTGSPNGVVNIQPNAVNVASFAPGASGNVVIGIAGNTNSIGFNTLTQTSVGAAGGATALPATPLGYMTVTVDGAAVKIPYYNP